MCKQEGQKLRGSLSFIVSLKLGMVEILCEKKKGGGGGERKGKGEERRKGAKKGGGERR